MISRRTRPAVRVGVASRRRALRAAGGHRALRRAHPNLTTVIHEIAKRTGAYERHNLKVVETQFKSGQTVEGVEQLWRGNLDFYMGGAPEVPRLNSRLIEAGGPPPLAVVSGANPGHTSLVLSNKLQPKSIDEILQAAAADRGFVAVVGAPRVLPRLSAHREEARTRMPSPGDSSASRPPTWCRPC